MQQLPYRVLKHIMEDGMFLFKTENVLLMILQLRDQEDLLWIPRFLEQE